MLMDLHAADALVTGYEDLIEGLELPDPDDRHVLAAAIRAGAHVIVTANLRDFPAKILGQFGIEPQHPDEFVLQSDTPRRAGGLMNGAASKAVRCLSLCVALKRALVNGSELSVGSIRGFLLA